MAFGASVYLSEIHSVRTRDENMITTSGHNTADEDKQKGHERPLMNNWVNISPASPASDPDCYGCLYSVLCCPAVVRLFLV